MLLMHWADKTLVHYTIRTFITGMAPDWVPRISSKDCGYPFTYLGGLYHSCAEMMENTTGVCERWGCVQVNYTGATCAAYVGMTPRYQAEINA